MRYWINAFLLLALSGTALSTYFIKYKTRELELELRQTQRLISQREEEITVLRGEFSYLSRPARLERLLRRFLKLQPVRSGQVITEDRLPPARFPAPPKEGMKGAVPAPGSDSPLEALLERILQTPEANSSR